MCCKKIYPAALCYAAALIVLAFWMDTPAAALEGLKTIVTTSDTLITDYMAMAGPGGALLNSALVIIESVAILYFSKAPAGGSVCGALGLMAGFSLFGKDAVNTLPIVLGGFLYAKFRKEPFGKYAATALMSTCLAPIVSALRFSSDHWLRDVAGLLVGVLIGFLVPLVSIYTVRIQKGMNLYNIGFACGLTSLMIVSVMASLDLAPSTVLLWSTGRNRPLGLFLFLLCAAFLLGGTFFSGAKPKDAWAAYRRLLTLSGRAPSDFLDACGVPATLINMGVNGALSTGYILLIGGDLNGPTLAGILTIIGFSACGKHAGNMLPVMLGAALGGLIMPGFSLTDPAIQFDVLFCTTLAPLSGSFGWPFGVLAGFLHISVVQRTGGPVSGLNLYNNGFTGGLVATVLYSILTPLGFLKHPEERDSGFYHKLP